MHASWQRASIAALAVALAALIALTNAQLGDYTLLVAENNAAPALAALATGDIDAAASVQPAMGGVSLLLRLPFVAAAGGDELLAYRLGTLACLLALVALAVVADGLAARRHSPMLRRLLLATALIAGPAGINAVRSGHPEELLGGALCALAVLAGLRQRWLAAALLLGAAIGTKHWALIAAVPVILSLEDHRWRTLLLAGAVTVAAMAPGFLANPDRFSSVQQSLGATERVYPQSLWLPVAQHQLIAADTGGGERVGIDTWSLPEPLRRSHTSLLTLLLAGGALLLLLGRRVAAEPLALLTALLALRCALDPMNLEYYAAPAMLALATWDAAHGPGDRLPVVTLALTALMALAWSAQVADLAPGIASALWLLSVLPLLLLPWLRLHQARLPAPAPPAAVSP